MINNKKSRAIKALKNCLAELEHSPINVTDVWIRHTAEFLKIYLGEDSELYNEMKDNSFHIVRLNEVSSHEQREFRAFQEDRFKEVLRRAINKIRTNGVYTAPKSGNWLTNIGDDWAVFIVGGAFAAGLLTQRIIDKYLFETPPIEDKIEQLEKKIDDLPFILRDASNKMPDPDSNKINQNK